MYRRCVSAALILLSLCGSDLLPVAAAQRRRGRRGRRASKVDITVSRETTYITGPLNADGTVNYVAWLNAKHSKGVTNENNALVLLAQAFGPEFISAKVRDAVLRRLHVPPLPANGKYFQRLDKHYFRGKAKDPAAAAKAAAERLEDAMYDPWKAKDDPVLAAWIAANKEPLKLVALASLRRRHFFPIISTSEPPCVVDLLLPAYRRVREAVKALAARAMLRLGTGDAAGAWSDVETGLRVARLLSQGMSLIERLTGIAIEATAMETCTAMAASEKLSAVEARKSLADLQRLVGLPDAWDAIDRGDRFMTLDLITTVARSGLGAFDRLVGQLEGGKSWKKLPSLRMDWNPTLRLINSHFDSFRAAGTKPTFAATKKALDACEAKRKQLLERAGATIGRYGGSTYACIRGFARASHVRGANKQELGRIMAPLFAGLVVPSLGNATALLERVRATGDLALVAMALAAHKAEKGRYPADLSALSPAYLKTIPKDRFNDKPLIYRRKGRGYILYSVGSNLKDDGGVDDFETGDIVVDAADD